MEERTKGVARLQAEKARGINTVLAERAKQLSKLQGERERGVKAVLTERADQLAYLQAETQRLAAADKARCDAEAAKVAQEQAALAKAASASDAEKLIIYASLVESIDVPWLTSPNGLAFNQRLNAQVTKMIEWLNTEANKL